MKDRSEQANIIVSRRRESSHNEREQMQTTQTPNGRGCGQRTSSVTYVCCGQSPFGRPIDEFVIDPPIPWPGKTQRGTKIMPRNPKDPDGTKDLVVFVGKQYYPFFWDFIEETKRYGASRKVGEDLPFDQLTPMESRMVFVHSTVLPKFTYELNRLPEPLPGCIEYKAYLEGTINYDGEPPELHQEQTICTFGLRDLAYLVHGDISPDDTSDEFYQVHMPSFIYRPKYPKVPQTYIPTRGKWQPAIFMALPLTHIEYKDKPNVKSQKNAYDAGFRTEVMGY